MTEPKVIGWVDGKHVPIPVNIDTVNKLFNMSISTEEEMDDWLVSCIFVTSILLSFMVYSPFNPTESRTGSV